jgi:uncharacterized protein YjiS (DUF1127 family)
MTTIPHGRIQAKARFTALSALHATVKLWLRRMITRWELRSLDARQLSDIGRTEFERTNECRKWFWQ